MSTDDMYDNNSNNILIQTSIALTTPLPSHNNNKLSNANTKRKKKKNKTKQAGSANAIEPFDSTPPTQLANADAGTTGNYFALKDITVLREVKLTNFGITVKQPDGSAIVSTHVGILDIPTIGPTTAHIFPTLVGSLISISVLVELGLNATYTKEHVIIREGEREVLRGNRDARSGLWMLDLSLFVQTHSAAPAIRIKTQADLCDFWHGTFGSPALSTFINAVDKGYIKLPGISASLLHKHAPNPLATSFWHLDQTRQGLRSTKTAPKEESVDSTVYTPT